MAVAHRVGSVRRDPRMQSAQADFVLFQRRIHSLWTADVPPLGIPRLTLGLSPRRRTSCVSSG
jgi:hypothetical protein